MKARAQLPLPLLALAFPLAFAGPGCTENGERLAGSPTTPTPIATPNVLIVTVDDWALSDLRASRRDANPWNDLPNVDALCAAGAEYVNGYAMTICNPTRATLMHGVYQGGKSGGVCNPAGPDTPPASLLTLGEVAQQAGYTTLASGKWHIGANVNGTWLDTPGSYGFTDWRAWTASNLGGFCQSQGYSDHFQVDSTAGVGIGRQSTEYHTLAVGNAVCDWWQATPGQKLAYVNFCAPHQPLHVPPTALLHPGDPITSASSRRRKYEAMLVAMDTTLGMILDVVDLTDTVVILLGDNGTPPAAVRQAQNRNKVKTTTFEDGVNVPFVVAGAGVVPGERAGLVHAVDLPATVAELVGVVPPADAFRDSVSFVPTLADPTARPRAQLICDYVEEGASGLPIRDTCVVVDTGNGLIKGRWYLDQAKATNENSFFDLELDPAETTPLDETDPAYRAFVRRARNVRNAFVAR